MLHANRDLCEALFEIVHNILKGNLRISAEHKEQLRKYKTILYKLASRNVSMKLKRKLLNKPQHGGFLAALLAPVLGIIANLVSGLINR